MSNDFHILPEFCTKKILVLGCGNTLFGDDGFGCAVADYLVEEYEIPSHIYVMDAGTGVRKLLFTLAISEALPDQIIIIDAVDKGRIPGDVFEISLDDVPTEKADDFSMHQAPTSNLAKDLQSRGVGVKVVVCQAEHIPEFMHSVLSEPVCQAVSMAGDRIARQLSLERISGSITYPSSSCLPSQSL
ncbi:MAG: hydrogenase maturation protease [Ignavibacteria bacterium]|nr:hydrogenase maturation protease [Ignavibacteria bacterium]